MAIDTTISDLVARGSARHPELRARLERAAFLVLFREVQPQLDGTWRVGSERDASKSYRVDLSADASDGYCDCPDSRRHPGDECKHSLAALILSRAVLGLDRHPCLDQAPASARVVTLPEEPIVDDRFRVIGWKPRSGPGCSGSARVSDDN